MLLEMKNQKNPSLINSPSNSLVVWLTGLPGAGKTTLAESFAIKFSEFYKIKVLDGDQLRKDYPALGFTKVDRMAHIGRVGKLAAEYERQGYIVVVALVSPYTEARDLARASCKKFFEVYVATPLKVCIQRDPKGLYKKALKNEIENFTGISDPYEVPTKPDLMLDTSKENLDTSLARIYALVSLSLRNP